MIYKIIGFVFVIISCGGVGFSMVVAHRREVHLLRCMLSAVSYMRCELECRQTPLPELCKKVSIISKNPIGMFFSSLAEELGNQIHPDPQSCMRYALSKMKAFPNSICECITKFTETLGMFSLQGQLRELNQTVQLIQDKLDKLTFEQDIRLRNYQTLSLCAGAAIAILLV